MIISLLDKDSARESKACELKCIFGPSCYERRYEREAKYKAFQLKISFVCIVESTCCHTAVSIKVVQKSVKAYATMPKGSLGNTQ